MQGAQLQSLVGELRSYVLCGAANNWINKYPFKVTEIKMKNSHKISYTELKRHTPCYFMAVFLSPWVTICISVLEWNNYLFDSLCCLFRASLVAPAMQETQVRSLVREDPLEKEMATHSSILAWRIPWTEEPGRLQSTAWISS